MVRAGDRGERAISRTGAPRAVPHPSRSVRRVVASALALAAFLVAPALPPWPSPAARANTALPPEPADTSHWPDLTAREAMGYRRGRPHEIQLVTLGWTEVELGTARAFLRMRDAAAEAGVTLFIRSGFRSHEQQAWLYRAWKEGWGNRAARPGWSNHQHGRALDLYLREPGTLAWLDANARRFGFRRTVRGEPWHWEYRPAARTKRVRTASR